MEKAYRRIKSLSATEKLIKIQQLKAEGKSQAQVIRELGICRRTVQRYWNETASISLQDAKKIETDKKNTEAERLRLERKALKKEATRLRQASKEYKSKYSGKHQMKYHRKRLYGVSPEQYNRMYEDQGGCCKICGVHQSESKRALSVDHDHATKKVRGLLCNRCNLGIGMLQDDTKILLSAIEYLQVA